MEIELRIFRQFYTEKSTIGRLDVNGEYFCETLEDRIQPKGVKIDGQTAIPEGFYTVKIDMSKKFKKLMPHIIDVEGFKGVRIHVGNYPKNTEGCILVGFVRKIDYILRSRDAFDKLMSILVKADKITLTII